MSGFIASNSQIVCIRALEGSEICINEFSDHSQLIFKRCGNIEGLIPCSEYFLSFFIFSFYFDTLRYVIL